MTVSPPRHVIRFYGNPKYALESIRLRKTTFLHAVTDRPKGAGHDRPKGATRRGCFWVSGVVKSSLKDPFCQALFS